ncbi:MAG: FeoA family protein [Planctomycetota bacterium]
METFAAHDHHTPESISLRALRAGDQGLVTGIHEASVSARRLAEFGLIRGATVEMIRAGAPCIIRIEHTRLSMGAALQDGVLLSRLR